MKEYEGVFRDFYGVEVVRFLYIKKRYRFNFFLDSGNFFDVIL